MIGLGIDLIETARLDRALARRGDRLLRRLFTDAELGACAGRKDRLLALAGRFAAKEAAMKALGTGWSHGIGWRDVEILREPGHPPRLELHGAAQDRARALGVRRAHVSVTHQPTAAAAVVVLE